MFVTNISKVYNDLLITKIINLPANKIRHLEFIR